MKSPGDASDRNTATVPGGDTIRGAAAWSFLSSGQLPDANRIGNAWNLVWRNLSLCDPVFLGLESLLTSEDSSSRLR